jgi:hypothetical protein
VCGKRLDDPVEQPVMPGLEPTSLAAAEVEATVAAMPGLEVTGHPAAEAEVAVTPLPGLEVTSERSPPVVSARMPGLITNDEAVGETCIPEEPPVHTSRCPRCRIEVGEAHFCPRCGFAVVVARGRGAGDLPPVRCLECGVQNPAERGRCMACGKRM